MKAGIFLDGGWICGSRAGRFVVVVVLLGAAVSRAVAQQEAADDGGIPGYLRVDTDRAGTQIWFGATHSLRGLDIGSNIYLVNATAELDIGPLFEAGKGLSLQPMVGAIFDFEEAALAYLVPQFYLYGVFGKWHLESWEMAYVGLKDEYRPHYFYNRTFLLYSLDNGFSCGPQAEFSFDLEELDDGGGLTSLAIGGAVSMGYGKNNTLGLFAGYEIKQQARGDSDGLVGRFTFIRQW